MAHINKQRPNTRLQIIQLAAKLYIENGYSKTTNKELATLLDVSPGNITFYFPTKDHLLSVLVNELCDFQSLLMEQAAEEGKSSLLAYCLELTSMAAACEDIMGMMALTTGPNSHRLPSTRRRPKGA